MIMNGEQLYELAQIREQEYMLEATLRRSGGRPRGRATSLIAHTARRLRRRQPSQG